MNNPFFYIWLRYYLNFCHKYGFENTDANSLHRYIEKLRSKKQNPSQQQQASNAVPLFYSLPRQKSELEQPINVDAKINKTVPVKEKRPVICLKQTMIFAPFRNSWGTAIFGRP
jgi:hypothetical protein